jgi:hypothetical protein
MLEVREEITDNVDDLFRMRDPQLEPGTFLLSDAQVGELVAKLFAHYYGAAMDDAAKERLEAESARPTQEGPAAEPPAPPTTQKSGSAKSSQTRSDRPRRQGRRARSRSSASSRT